MEDKKNYGYISVLKGIGILAVIIGHLLIPDWLARYLYSFHIPIFFMISGYLYNVEKWKGNLKELTFKRLKTYMLPYITIALFIIISNMIEYMVIDKRQEAQRYLMVQLQGMLLSKSSSEWMVNFVPMWFLPCLFICSIIFYIVTSCKYTYKKTHIQRIIIIAMVTINCIIIGADLKPFPWQLDTTLFAVPFMYLGYIIKQKEWCLEKKYVLLFVIIGFIFGVINPGYVHFLFNRYGNVLFMFVSAICTCLALFYIAQYIIKKNCFLEFLGENTIIIIGFDYYIDHVIGRVAMALGADYYSKEYAFIRAIEVIAALLLITFIYNKLKNKFKSCKCRVSK